MRMILDYYHDTIDFVVVVDYDDFGERNNCNILSVEWWKTLDRCENRNDEKKKKKQQQQQLQKQETLAHRNSYNYFVVVVVLPSLVSTLVGQVQAMYHSQDSTKRVDSNNGPYPLHSDTILYVHISKQRS